MKKETMLSYFSKAGKEAPFEKYRDKDPERKLGTRMEGMIRAAKKTGIFPYGKIKPDDVYKEYKKGGSSKKKKHPNW